MLLEKKYVCVMLGSETKHKLTMSINLIYYNMLYLPKFYDMLKSCLD